MFFFKRELCEKKDPKVGAISCIAKGTPHQNFTDFYFLFHSLLGPMVLPDKLLLPDGLEFGKTSGALLLDVVSKMLVTFFDQQLRASPHILNECTALFLVYDCFNSWQVCLGWQWVMQHSKTWTKMHCTLITSTLLHTNHIHGCIVKCIKKTLDGTNLFIGMVSFSSVLLWSLQRHSQPHKTNLSSPPSFFCCCQHAVSANHAFHLWHNRLKRKVLWWKCCWQMPLLLNL